MFLRLTGSRGFWPLPSITGEYHTTYCLPGGRSKCKVRLLLNAYCFHTIAKLETLLSPIIVSWGLSIFTQFCDVVLVFAHFAGVEIRHRTVLCLARGHTAHEVAELVFELGSRTPLSFLRSLPTLCVVPGMLGGFPSGQGGGALAMLAPCTCWG